VQNLGKSVSAFERIGESLRGWVSLCEVERVCERSGESVKGFLSL
jgi:hypothetical protein